MATFGEFFIKLRARIERTGRTDSACGDMNSYKRERCTQAGVVPFGEEDPGWLKIADQELSHSNLLDFSIEMTRVGVKRLAARVNTDRFDPDSFIWDIDAVHEFHHAMLEEADGCGLDVRDLTSWAEARDERVRQNSTSKEQILSP